MSRRLLAGGACVLVAATACFLGLLSDQTEPPFEPVARLGEPAPLCPWREPRADLDRFFPEATHHSTGTRILSGVRVELTRQLGRTPDPDESTLQVHEIFREKDRLGVVLVKRVKGAHGALEIVVGVDNRGAVRRVRLQRQREPEAIAAAIGDPRWLGTFEGRTADHGWDGSGIENLPEAAAASAQAVRNGVRDSLILLELSGSPAGRPAPAPHH